MIIFTCKENKGKNLLKILRNEKKVLKKVPFLDNKLIASYLEIIKKQFYESNVMWCDVM